MKKIVVEVVGLIVIGCIFANAEVYIFADTAGYLVNYTFNSGKALGVRIRDEENFSYYGLNFRNPIEKFSSKSLKIYGGLEIDYVSSFEGQNSKGKGGIGYLSIGGIYSLGRINFLLEIGPGVIFLKDRNSGISITEFDPGIYTLGIGFRI